MRGGRVGKKTEWFTRYEYKILLLTENGNVKNVLGSSRKFSWYFVRHYLGPFKSQPVSRPLVG